MHKDSIGYLYDFFADLLSYPTASIPGQAEGWFAQLQDAHPEAAAAGESFLRGLKQCALERLKELYTTTFDMQPVCFPYVGYHLFGESYKRGAFMARLNEAYRASGYSPGQELPDHISVILRFLGMDSTNRQGEFCHTLLYEGLVPASEKMLKVFGEASENPYFGLISALHHFLVHAPEKELSDA